MLHESFDRSALTGSVASFEHDGVPCAGFFRPVLQLEEFDLQQTLGHFVLVPRHPCVVRVALPPGVDLETVRRRQQHRIVVVIVVDGEGGGVGQIDGGRKIREGAEERSAFC